MRSRRPAVAGPGASPKGRWEARDEKEWHRRELGEASAALGWLAFASDHLAYGGPRALRAGVTINRRRGADAGIAKVLTNPGNVYRLIGDYPRAVAAQRESLRIAEEIGDARGDGEVLRALETRQA